MFGIMGDLYMLLVVICLISLLISIPGLISKAGYSFFKGLIPGYNLYLFFFNN